MHQAGCVTDASHMVIIPSQLPVWHTDMAHHYRYMQIILLV